MDSVTEACLKSFRTDIDYLTNQLDQSTRAFLLLAAQQGYLDRAQLAGMLKNPQRVHVTVVYNEPSDPNEPPGMSLEITQPAEDDTPQHRASLLPRHKLERAYVATHERALIAEKRLSEYENEARAAKKADAPESPKVGVPEPPVLDGKPISD